MQSAAETQDLVFGLRALEMLARHAPLDLEDFARLSGAPVAIAHALLDVFEQFGYVRRLTPSNVYVLGQAAQPGEAGCSCQCDAAAGGHGIVPIARIVTRPTALLH